MRTWLDRFLLGVAVVAFTVGMFASVVVLGLSLGWWGS